MIGHIARLLLVTALAAPVVVGSTGRAEACSCAAGRGTVEAKIAATDVVFVGTALHGRFVPGSDVEFDPWTFEVESVQKGDDRDRFLVDTDSQWPVFYDDGRVGGSASSCGFPVTAGVRYQIFARVKNATTLVTSTCSSSRRLEAPQLWHRIEPYEFSREWPAAAIAAGAVVALAFAVAKKTIQLNRSAGPRP